MDRICRICVKISISKNLKRIMNQDEDFIKRIKTFIDLEEHTDLLNICCSCNYELGIAYDFVNKCAAASEKLKNYIELQENNKFKEENSLLQDISSQKESNIESSILVKKEYLDETKETVFAECISTCPTLNDCADLENCDTKYSNTNHQCKECSDLFETQHALHIHSKIKHQKTYKCDQCFKEFKQKGSMISHKQTHQVFSCPVCSRQFSRKSVLERHAKSHNDDKYCFKCTVCPKKFTIAYNLTRHMLIHEGIKPFVCDMCGKTFTQKVVLDTHMKIHERLTQATENNLIDGTTCKLCHRSFKNTRCLFHHLTKHHGKAGETYNKKVLPRSFQCEECGKCLKGYKTWQLHQGTHSDVKPFSCDICSKSFRLAELLKRHKRVHTGEKPYQCTVCSMHFGAHANLIKHIRKHTGEKPFKCEHCEMAFASSFNMRRHAKRHEKCILSKNSIKHNVKE